MSQRPPAAVVDVRDAYCLLEADGATVAALRGLDLRVGAGERIVIQGPNGSGKTTLLRVLVGEQALSAGEAHVAGWSVGRIGRGDRTARRELPAWRARHIGWVDQFTARTLRPELDVLGNVALQQRLNGVRRNVARRWAIQALENVGVEHLADRAIQQLSGGEAQRVAVAAALVHRPTVVFADEPAGQLDAASAEEVYSALAAAASGAGAALVMVSHDLRACRVGDRVLRLRDGRVSETWRPDAPDDELLVVDPRGWVRLPASVRRQADLEGRIQVKVVDGVGVLIGADTAEDDPDALFRRPTPREPVVSLSAPSPVSTPDVDRPTVAQCRGVARRFAERTVLDHVDLRVGAGAIHVVHGRSGSGKSTLLRVLVGLDDPDEGSVDVLDTSLASLDREARAELRRRSVGMVLQEIHLDETTSLLANLELARAVRGHPADRAADVAALEQLGLGDLLHRHARYCSGGERQRAALARAVVGAPALVVLDEPTSQLDDSSAALVVSSLHELAQRGAAVVIASHDPVVIAAATVLVDLDPR